MEYTVIRSDRRTLALEITADARVILRAPRRCADKEIEAFVAAHEGWVQQHLARQQARKQAFQVTPEQEQALRRQAAELFPRRVAHYSRVMGLTPGHVRITGAKTRFGSCSGRNWLCFSWRLMLYPAEAIDYVVVHELAHIRHHDHSPAFHALVASVLPDHIQRRALLRQPPPGGIGPDEHTEE